MLESLFDTAPQDPADILRTVFGTPTEITLSELVIEAFLPADAETAALLSAVGGEAERYPVCGSTPSRPPPSRGRCQPGGLA